MLVFSAIVSFFMKKIPFLGNFFWRYPGLVLAKKTWLKRVPIFISFLCLRVISLRKLSYFHHEIPVQPGSSFPPDRGGVCENLPYRVTLGTSTVHVTVVQCHVAMLF